MFGFFKKKGGEIPEEQQRQQRGAQEGQTRQDAAEVPQEFRALGQDFLPEELNILAVTGASGFGGGRSQGEKLWTASIGLTAWMEEDSPDIHQGDFRLVALADDRLMDYLRQRVPRDFIIKCRARLSVDGSRLLMLELPQPGFDPDLKAILDEQKKPVSTWVEGLGTFTLNRTVDWFEATVDWLGSEIALDFDRGVPEEMASAQETGRALMASQADWDHRVRSYAAQELVRVLVQRRGSVLGPLHPRHRLPGVRAGERPDGGLSPRAPIHGISRCSHVHYPGFPIPPAAGAAGPDGGPTI